MSESIVMEEYRRAFERVGVLEAEVARLRAEVERLTRERPEWEERAEAAARRGEFWKEVAKIEFGERHDNRREWGLAEDRAQAAEAERDAALRERDEARDRARKERAVATEAAAVLEMTVSAMRGEPADDFAESFVPIQIAQDLWRANAANLAESASLRSRCERLEELLAAAGVKP